MAGRGRRTIGDRDRALPTACRDRRAQRRVARGAGLADRQRGSTRGPRWTAVPGRDLCWRRYWRCGVVADFVGEAGLLGWHANHGGALTRITVSRAESRAGHHLWR